MQTQNENTTHSSIFPLGWEGLFASKPGNDSWMKIPVEKDGACKKTVQDDHPFVYLDPNLLELLGYEMRIRMETVDKHPIGCERLAKAVSDAFEATGQHDPHPQYIRLPRHKKHQSHHHPHPHQQDQQHQQQQHSKTKKTTQSKTIPEALTVESRLAIRKVVERIPLVACWQKGKGILSKHLAIGQVLGSGSGAVVYLVCVHSKRKCIANAPDIALRVPRESNRQNITAEIRGAAIAHMLNEELLEKNVTPNIAIIFKSIVCAETNAFMTLFGRASSLDEWIDTSSNIISLEKQIACMFSVHVQSFVGVFWPLCILGIEHNDYSVRNVLVEAIPENTTWRVQNADNTWHIDIRPQGLCVRATDFELSSDDELQPVRKDGKGYSYILNHYTQERGRRGQRIHPSAFDALLFTRLWKMEMQTIFKNNTTTEEQQQQQDTKKNAAAADAAVDDAAEKQKKATKMLKNISSWTEFVEDEIWKFMKLGWKADKQKFDMLGLINAIYDPKIQHKFDLPRNVIVFPPLTEAGSSVRTQVFTMLPDDKSHSVVSGCRDTLRRIHDDLSNAITTNQ